MHNPFVPESLEGWSVLHLMYRVRWDRLRSKAPADIQRMADEANRALAVPDAGATAAVQMLGHKGDLMFICFRRSFEALAQAQLALSRTELHDFLDASTSYVSIVELGMYEMTAKIHEQLGAKHKPGSEEFDRAFDAEMESQRQRVMGRLFLEIPKWRYVCFYPMNKKRKVGENWFTLPKEDRGKLMIEHARSGMAFAGKVSQLTTVGLGLDDWEWGVTLWAANPEYLKEIVYRMRFDEASARYAEFGPFYTGYVATPAEILSHCEVK